MRWLPEDDTINEGKRLTSEIAELLQSASMEQKLVIKGILLGVNSLNAEENVIPVKKEPD